jgi:hypothetical protein
MPDPAFACDEMLGRLARYLRAAGYDTTLAEGGAPDSALLARAAREGRIFLTRDLGVAEHAAARGIAHVLPTADLDAAAAILRRDLGVDWLHRPFTRCLVDNAVLHAIADAERDSLPLHVAADTARRCPRCGRTYWAGSHHRRMRERLEAWAA